ncbi:MFS transporter [Streptococcus dysgalactiae]|uniref:Membrane protein n=2 Tax=Streptococcus dysgalactiae TaxID=1334 RepID=A0A9X9SJD3_STRDY|nr:major facilitator superfamily domain-containing protein 9 [Streptococcus dysgalactiae]VTS42212.1 Membrane protein [Streptococcus dysgalactiae subsp. equisimilis]VTS87605.1 Membrane protein [Streptococcus dysgalactiae]
MDKIDDGLIASTFQKVKDVDIFALKAYMESTEGLETGLQVTLTDIFVNFPFFLLNLIVGFFSIILRFFENFSLYNTYRQTVFDSSKVLWDNLSKSADFTNSLLYLLIALSAFSIFLAFIFSKGDFSRRLLHLFAVMLLAFGYFGTVQSTSGGVYVLDMVHSVASSFSDAVTNLSVVSPEDEKQIISHEASVADNYVMKTSYTAYLFVNTGQLNGKFHNNKSGKEEELDNSKILGKYDKSNQFVVPKSQQILEYTNKLGDGALKGEEQNRWMSAVSDYIWIKSIYVILKIFEAVILAIPLLLIQLIAFLADIVVILLMFLFPLALLVSFLPKMQHIAFNMLKLMLGSVSFPALTGFLTLIVFYIQSLIATFIKSRFTDGDLLSSSNLKGQSILFMLFITIIIQGVVFWQIWKHKEKVLSLIVGSSAAQAVTQAGNMVAQQANGLGVTPKNIYDKAHDVSNLAMMGAGYGVGSLVHARENLNAIKNRFRGDNTSDYNDLSNETNFDHQFSESGGFVGDQEFSEGSVSRMSDDRNPLSDYQEEQAVYDNQEYDQENNFSYDSFDFSQGTDFERDNLNSQSFDGSLDDSEPLDHQFSTNVSKSSQTIESTGHDISYDLPVVNEEMKSPFLSESDYQSKGFSSGVETPEIDDMIYQSNQKGNISTANNYPSDKKPLENSFESPIVPERSEPATNAKEPFNSQAEYQRLKAKRQKPLGNRQKAKLEAELGQFTDDDSYYKAHGRTAFQRGFNASKSKELRLKQNVERKATILAELDKLRGHV